MNITTKLVLRHFLAVLYKNMETMKIAEISTFSKNFLLHKELIAIVQWMYPPDELEDTDLACLPYDELMDMIGSDYYVLGYYLDLWDQSRKAQERPTASALWKILEQLGHPTHYLASKGLDQWDEYDISNCRALQAKTGKVVKVYGVYGSRISQDDVETVTSPPNRYYDTEEEAQEGLEELLTTGIFKPKELAIRYTYKGI